MEYAHAMVALRAEPSWASRSSRLFVAALALACCLCSAVQAAGAETVPPEGCPAPPPGVPAMASSADAAVPQPAPAQILVCAAGLPITGAVFVHWSEVARDSEGAAPKHPATGQEVTKEVLGFLISSDWVTQEAQALRIVISARAVRRRFERIRAQQFPKAGEFGAFLNSSGQTPADLLYRVRLNLLSSRIQAHVVSGHRSARAREHALERFAREFGRRWKARTYCTPEYAVADCGHVVAPPL